MNPPHIAGLEDDEPLPENYGRDCICVLSQSPFVLFVYWELKDNPFETLAKAFGGLGAGYRLAVRLTDLGLGEAKVLEVGPAARNLWLEVSPGRTYVVEVGLIENDHPFICLLTSEEITTPRAAESHAAETPASTASPATTTPIPRPPCERARRLRAAGRVKRAVVVLFKLDRVRCGGATALVARACSAEDLREMNRATLKAMQRVLLALALREDCNKLLEKTFDEEAGRWLTRTGNLNGLDRSHPGKTIVKGIPSVEQLYEQLYCLLCLPSLKRAPASSRAPSSDALLLG